MNKTKEMKYKFRFKGTHYTLPFLSHLSNRFFYSILFLFFIHSPPSPLTHPFLLSSTEENQGEIYQGQTTNEMEGTCNEKGYTAKRAAPFLCKIIAFFIFLAGVTALTLWLVYRPHKPRFSVAGAAIYNLNVTSPPFLSTSMQFTLVTRNPNKRVGIIYDNLSAYVSYRNQQITTPVYLPPFYQETKSTVALSPVLGGGPVPVSAEVVNGLMIDESYGVVSLRVVLLGRLRWKAGAIRTGRYGVYVKCDIWIGLKKGFVGEVPLLGSPACKVDI